MDAEFLKDVLTWYKENKDNYPDPPIVSLGKEKQEITYLITDADYMGQEEIFSHWFKCPQCGNKDILIYSKYCSDCGKKLGWSIQEGDYET